MFDNYLSLSFSYMSFVIKDMIERKHQRSVEFDSEPYNYLFNKRTSLTDSEFTKIDSEELNYVLENFQKIGPH